MHPKPLYVEALIRTDLDALWRHTQDPVLHRRWDLRFTDIAPLTAGRFRYATKVLGLRVTGLGTHSGERFRPDGTRTSVLRFASTDPLSLIRAGSGFWRYTPTDDGIRFITGFDYDTRWGRFGTLADVAFRPLFGWMTAWSFDRLRIWLETGTPPERQSPLAPSAARCRRSRPTGRHGAAPRALAALERP
ncbi:hypothetical protein ACH347_04915 [Saccharopolyspora sp. 5N102]|uniref:hypothetical protein n=1 Tax=Saccharopolyspora sp. 5N102 TaxID=3375155 RepID=UPI0037B23B32